MMFPFADIRLILGDSRRFGGSSGGFWNFFFCCGGGGGGLGLCGSGGLCKGFRKEVLHDSQSKLRDLSIVPKKNTTAPATSSSAMDAQA